MDRRVELWFADLAKSLIRRRWLVIVACALLTAGFARLAGGLTTNTSNDYFFLHGDPFIERYNDFKETFGSDEFVYVLFTAEDVFTPEVLHAIEAFSQAATDEIPYVRKVTSILDVERITATDDTVMVEPLIGDVPTGLGALAEIRRRALANPLYTDTFVSADGRHTGVVIETEKRPGDGTFPKAITDAVYGLVDREAFARYQPKVVGPPILDATVDGTVATEFGQLGGISLLLIFTILVWSFRRFAHVVAPMVVIVLTNIWVFGLMAVTGTPLTMMSFILPALIMVVGCGDAIHVIAEYRARLLIDDDSDAALVETIRRTGLPCLFTSLTTAAGFGSLVAMEIRPGRELGVFAAVAVIIAFVLSVTLLPALLSFGGPRTAKHRATPPIIDALLRATARLAVRRPAPIIVVSALLLIVAGFGLTKIDVAADFLRDLDEDTRIRQDYDYVDTNLGGTVGVSIVLDSGAPSGIFEPEFLADLAALDTWLDEYELTRTTASVLDVFEELVAVTSTTAPAGARPASSEHAAQLFLLYEMGGAEEIDRFVTPERDRAVLTARFRSVPTSRLTTFAADLDRWVDANLSHTSVTSTGLVPLIVTLVEYITRSQLASFSLAFTAVLLMMMLQFRSVKMGLLAMVPNVFPIVITLGYMGYQGILLNVGTVMIASIAIGIAVDDSIHFVTHFRHYREAGQSTAEAIQTAITGVGQALLTTSIVLALGFSVFGTSSMSHLVNFGLLTALTVVTALAADFLLLPALLLALDRGDAS